MPKMFTNTWKHSGIRGAYRKRIFLQGRPNAYLATHIRAFAPEAQMILVRFLASNICAFRAKRQIQELSTKAWATPKY